MRYLDPKNDLTFKRIFGEHPHLVKSLLNALMPLQAGQLIEKVEYLPAELVPDIPGMKDSIVDVRCIDNYGRQFIVEMQMLWTPSFQARVLFNASKAYIKQLDKGRHYESLQPVYALSLLNDVYVKDSDAFYHHYSIVNVKDTNQKLDGLEFVFVELPKFKPERTIEKRMTVLWLRFLTEIQDGSESIPEELMRENDIVQALEILQESAFSKAELEYYDRIWDRISKERTLLHERTRLAEEEGRKKGREEGIAEGIAKGEYKKQVEIAVNLLKSNLDLHIISESTGLTIEEIKELKNRNA